MWPLRSPDTNQITAEKQANSLKAQVDSLEKQIEVLTYEMRKFNDTPVRVAAIHTKCIRVERRIIAFEKRQIRMNEARKKAIKQLFDLETSLEGIINA